MHILYLGMFINFGDVTQIPEKCACTIPSEVATLGKVKPTI